MSAERDRLRASLHDLADTAVPTDLLDRALRHSRRIARREAAIGTDQDRRFVMVVGADDKVSYRQVSLGGAVDGMRLVTSGLKPGERIVVNGLQRIRPGALVAPQHVAMTAPATLATR